MGGGGGVGGGGGGGVGGGFRALAVRALRAFWGFRVRGARFEAVSET